MENNQTVIKAKGLARSFIERMTWEQCQKILKHYKLSTGLGSAKTLVKLESDFDQSELLAQTFITKVEPIHRDLMRAGNKTVMVYDLHPDSFSVLSEKASTVEVLESDEQKTFPSTIDVESLSDIGENTKLIHQEVIGSKSFFYFSTKRTITEKKKLSVTMFDLPEEVRKELSKYSTITGLSEQPRQFIDVVVLDHVNHRLELRLDIAHAVSSRDLSSLFDRLRYSFKNKLKVDDSINLFSDPINFFPMIAHTYDNSDIRVCEISFTTDGYVHHERDRNSSSNEEGLKGDVRYGEFHIGGIERCDKINLYRISSRWEKMFKGTDLNFDVELSLNSSYRELNKEEPENRLLDHVVFTMCPTLEAMDSILCDLIESEQNDLSNAAS